jgi:hypothetical protein
VVDVVMVKLQYVDNRSPHSTPILNDCLYA